MMLRSLILTFTFTAIQGRYQDSPGLYQVTKPVDHAEGPVWIPEKNALYFVDIHNGQVNCYNYGTGNLKTLTLGGEVSIVLPSKYDPDLLIIAQNRSVVTVNWDGYEDKDVNTEALTTVANQFPTSRFNDGKADRQGRLWFGTMGFEYPNGTLDPNQGSLYLITQENLANPEVKISPVNISNGLAWNSDNTKFYYIDTPTRKVMEYEYDDASATISNPRVAFDVNHYKNTLAGFPDGMTIDSEDFLWVALYAGGAVVKVDPNSGSVMQIITIPAQAVTSVAFGGPAFDVLFVTTSRYTLSKQERLQQRGAGAVWAITNLGVTGVASFKADILDSAVRKE